MTNKEIAERVEAFNKALPRIWELIYEQNYKMACDRYELEKEMKILSDPLLKEDENSTK